jgi:glycosyltransferase involved in cell wall biosynthesis
VNLIHIIAGTGNFECESCARDTGLAAALRARGHQALCVPLYLPLVTDRPDVVNPRIFFGGINVYLQQKFRLFRATPAWLDRLWDRPRLLRWSARAGTMTSARELGEHTLSMLGGEEGRQLKELNKLSDWLRREAQPDLISLSNGLLLGLARRLKQDLGVPVVCTLQGEDGFLDDLPSPYREQAWDVLRDRARDVDLFIAVSHYYRDRMRDRLALPAERVVAVYSGLTFDGYAPRGSLPDPPVIGYLARMSETKGLDTLVEAFLHLHREESLTQVRLHVAGAEVPPEAPFVGRVRARLERAGLLDRVQFRPNLPAAARSGFLQGLTALSVPATYPEAYGPYLLEAWACGVPVAQPRLGVFTELLESTGGGVLCEPKDPRALATALAGLVRDGERNIRLGNEGRRAVLRDFTAARMADRMVELFKTRGWISDE